MVFDLHRKMLRQSVKGGKTKHPTNLKIPTNLNFLPILDKIKVHININSTTCLGFCCYLAAYLHKANDRRDYIKILSIANPRTELFLEFRNNKIPPRNTGQLEIFQDTNIERSATTHDFG